MAAHLHLGEPGAGMSYDLPIEWGCHGKQSFDTRHDAQRVIHRRSINRHQSRGRCEPYRCHSCGRWHVGAGVR